MRKTPFSQRGLLFKKSYIQPSARQALLDYLLSLYPIWEMRFSEHNPPPSGQQQRRLLRPVYWLGNWQFACLNYYHPPKGIHNRCVHAEPYPPVLAEIVHQIESLTRQELEPQDIPPGWHLNTCLINYYGDQVQKDKRIDCARVGEHKDFELGPVASLSFGERALFQFIKSSGHQARSEVAIQQWLGDCDLQVFGGYRFKKQLFHRVQRVERKDGHHFKLPVENFETRRINLTFRYVPDEHILPWHRLPETAKADTKSYMQELAKHSEFFKNELSK